MWRGVALAEIWGESGAVAGVVLVSQDPIMQGSCAIRRLFDFDVSGIKKNLPSDEGDDRLKYRRKIW